MTIPLSDLSPSDRQEIADFADLLRAKAGMPPIDQVPEPVCVLVRERKQRPVR